MATKPRRPRPPLGWWVVRAGAAIAVRPSLWSTAVRQVFVLAPDGWWRRPPFLPLPDRDYLAFRLQTQYGGDGTTPPVASDVVHYLRWCRRVRRAGHG